MLTNSILKNRGLGIAIAVSILVHAIVLSVKFATPVTSHSRYTPPVIKIVLGSGSRGNSGSGGSGDGQMGGTGMAGANGTVSQTVVDTGTIAEKIPDKPVLKNKSTESRPITSLSSGKDQKSIPVPERKTNRTQKNGTTVSGIQNGQGGIGGGRGEGDSVVFNRNARGGYDYGNGGGQVITSQTRNVSDALYFKSVRKKVESIGVINFPQKNGTRLYGQLTVRINVYHDGSLYEKNGGVSVVKSSGNPALDAAALNIVRRAAPFGRFNGNVRSIITRLNFTRDQGLKSQVVRTVS